VHARDDDNEIAVDAVIDGVRKTTQKRSSGVSANNWISKRLLGDAINQYLSRSQKVMSQARALTFVPEKCLFDVRRCSRTDGQCTALACAVADAVENFIPGNADRSFSIKLVKPSVELFSLGIR
jgi:hypothetical protein